MVDMFRMYCQIINLASALTIHVILDNVLPLSTEELHLLFCECVLCCSKYLLFLCVCDVHPNMLLKALFLVQVLEIEESGFVSA
jgi:hypothetical protein